MAVIANCGRGRGKLMDWLYLLPIFPVPNDCIIGSGTTPIDYRLCASISCAMKMPPLGAFNALAVGSLGLGAG